MFQLILILYIVIRLSISEPVLKDDTSAEQSCNDKIIEIEQIMLRSFGADESNEWIKKVKESPELYVNHAKPIIVELANAIIDERVSKMNMRDTYVEMQKIKNQMKELENKVNQILNGENEIPINVDFGTLSTSAGSYSFSIPDSVPVRAKKLLFYVYFQSGGCVGDNMGGYEIISHANGRDYSQFFTFHTYHQNAWSYNSDSFWLPMPESRTISLKIKISKGKYGGNCAGYLRIIRYTV